MDHALQKRPGRDDDRRCAIGFTRQPDDTGDVIVLDDEVLGAILDDDEVGIVRQFGLADVKGHQVAFPDTLVGTDSHTPHVDALGVIAVGVGG
ncbi:aconitase family protein, partial [Cobetia sp. Dlab-2-U]|nr:aconitase family protein [Cobetia sp. Dlab-2-U]